MPAPVDVSGNTPPVVAVYAGFWRRFWALAADVIVVSLVSGIIARITRGNEVQALTLLFAVVYFVGLTMEGGTLGKRMLSLRVVRADGSRIDGMRAFLRELIGKPLSAIVLFAGFLWVTVSRRKQAWHDIIVDTVVVHERSSKAAPPWANRPPWVR